MNRVGISKTTGKRLPGRGWMLAMAGIAILLALLLVLTPYFMAWSARYWLQESGLDLVELQDIDLNPFTGVLVVEQLHLQEDGKDTLVIPRACSTLTGSRCFPESATSARPPVTA